MPVQQKSSNIYYYFNQSTNHGMCYSHFRNVCKGAISIMPQGFINDRYKVNPICQWGKFLVIAMGFVDHLGPALYFHFVGHFVDGQISS